MSYLAFDSIAEHEKHISIGISACLLGMEVRYNGGHKRDALLLQQLTPYVQWVHVCPEVEMGMPIPRETIRLERSGKDPVDESRWTPESTRLMAPKSGTNYSEPMLEFSHRRVAELMTLDLDGFILKKGSPSCGMERLPVYGPDKGRAIRKGVGYFSAVLMDRMPYLPVEEEGRLNDSKLKENFIERVFAYRRLKEFIRSKPDRNAIVQFHTRHKLTFMSHNIADYRELGRLVANQAQIEPETFLNTYQRAFMQGLKAKATVKRHTNVLYHILGYFKKCLARIDREELVELVEAYRLGRVPLVVPMTLIRHHLRHHSIPWLEQQVYLNPYPEELMLRNSI